MTSTESFTQMTMRFAINVTKAAFKLLGYSVDESELEKAVKGLVVQQKKVYILWNTTKNEHGIHFQQKDESAIMELLTDITGISQKKLCRKWQGVSFPHAQEENITSVLEEAGYNVCKKEAAEFDGPVWNELSVVEEAKLKAETLGARKVKSKPPTSITNEDLQELIASEVKSRKTGSKSKLDDWDPSKSSAAAKAATSGKSGASGKSATKSAKPAAPKAKKSTTGKSSGARVPTKKNRWGNFVEDTYNLAFFDFFTTESKDKVQVCIGVQNTDLDTPDKGGDGGFATLLPIYDHLDLVKLFEKKSGKKLNLLDYDFAQTIKSEKLYDSLAEAELFLVEGEEEEEEVEGVEEEEDQEEAPADEDLEEEDLFEGEDEDDEEDLEEEEEEEF